MKKNILLLHGWDYDLYTKLTNETNAWSSNTLLLEELNKNFNVYTLNFPGFCGEPEPNEAWDVDDFARFINAFIQKNNLTIDIIFGYSFGGAVAVQWKHIYKSKTKLFLVAPAIIRNSVKSKRFFKTPQMIEKIRIFVRDIYVAYIIKNPEMKHGDRFLRNTYQIIVRRDMRKELYEINGSEVFIVFGENDSAVDSQTIIRDNIFKGKILTIDDSDHENIITSHSEYVVNILSRMIN